MADAQTSPNQEVILESLRRLRYDPPPEGDVIYDMLSKPAADWLRHGPVYLAWLLRQINAQAGELSDLRKAMEMYATQMGDPLFGQSLDLCLQQVRMNR